MSTYKPTIPSGTRDLGPDQMAKRNYVLSIIENVMRKYGFLPLETPGMEKLAVLTGKYGEEGDQLIYKILNSGDFLKKVDSEDIHKGYKSVLPKLSEKGLRYDLTVPFARYVAMNQNEIVLPFKRYQIQPVWRADRPQKGRYREFLQCDADVIGSDSLVCEAEMVLLIKEIFTQLRIEKYAIRINHRSVLSELAEMAGSREGETEFCTAIDKMDKIGEDGVRELLIGKEFDATRLPEIFKILKIKGSPDQAITDVENSLSSKTGSASNTGIEDMRKLLEILDSLGEEVPELVVDPSLARGLTYYTGTIIEVTLEDRSMGSLSGGGRYDDLTGAFGWPNIPGVGFSLGIDRIANVLEAKGLYPDGLLTTTKVLIAAFDEPSFSHGLSLLVKLRKLEISTEIYPTPVKIKKQLDYANRKKIPYVVLIGENELQAGAYTLKNMKTGEQVQVPAQELEKELMALANE